MISTASVICPASCAQAISFDLQRDLLCLDYGLQGRGLSIAAGDNLNGLWPRFQPAQSLHCLANGAACARHLIRCDPSFLSSLLRIRSQLCPPTGLRRRRSACPASARAGPVAPTPQARQTPPQDCCQGKPFAESSSRHVGIFPFVMVRTGALPHRGGQRAFIEIIEFAADRHAMGQPGHLDVGILQQVGDVMRGGLAVDRCIEGKDDFA